MIALLWHVILIALLWHASWKPYWNIAIASFVVFTRIWHSPPWRAHLHPMFMIPFVNHCAKLGWGCKCAANVVILFFFLAVMLFECSPVEPCFPCAGVVSLRPRLGGEPPWFIILSLLCRSWRDGLVNLELLFSLHVHRRRRHKSVVVVIEHKLHLDMWI